MKMFIITFEFIETGKIHEFKIAHPDIEELVKEVLSAAEETKHLAFTLPDGQTVIINYALHSRAVISIKADLE